MILRRIEAGQGRPIDADLLLDVSDNINIGLTFRRGKTDLPARPVGHLADHVDHELLQGRGPPAHRAGAVPVLVSGCKPEAGSPEVETVTTEQKTDTVKITVDGLEMEARPATC